MGINEFYYDSIFGAEINMKRTIGNEKNLMIDVVDLMVKINEFKTEYPKLIITRDEKCWLICQNALRSRLRTVKCKVLMDKNCPKHKIYFS